MKFSISTQSFYAEGLKFGASLPVDAIEIEQGTADKLFLAINNGAHVYSESGVLKASEPRPDKYHSWYVAENIWTITEESAQQQKYEQISAAGDEKDARVNFALQSIGLLQLKLQAGRTLTEAERTRLNAVLDYIDEVTAIDTSTAPDINWPKSPVG